MAAGIAFADWTSDTIARALSVRIDRVEPYRPGHFYERELPCLLKLLEVFGAQPAAIVIDGYVTLGATGRDGLGAHLFRRLDGEVPIIGVAKSRFSDTPDDTQVLRGQSARPLYVTSLGIAQTEAKRLIADMHGDNHMPTLLTAVDHAGRGL